MRSHQKPKCERRAKFNGQGKLSKVTNCKILFINIFAILNKASPLLTTEIYWASR